MSRITGGPTGDPSPGPAVRPERAGDEPEIRRLHLAAFPTDAEARLVDALRRSGRDAISLVAAADSEDRLLGHVLFSPVTLGGRPGGLGLAPMGVAPSHQRQGVGTRLVEAGLEACRAAGTGCVVVLGEPDYYARFGFRPAREWDLQSEYEAPEAFMAIELRDGAIPRRGGLVRYAPEFASL